MGTKKVSFCFIDYSLSGDFFLRLASSDKDRTYVLLTTCLSVLNRSRGISNVKVIFITSMGKTKNIDFKFEDYLKTRESFLSLQSYTRTKNFLSRTSYELGELIDDYAEHEITLLCWGGESAFGFLIRKYQSHGISSLFFEISNLPGKLFVDKKGVNASSSLFSNLEDLNSFYKPNEIDKLWLNKFIESKINPSYVIPQSKASKSISFSLLLDFIGSIISFRTFSIRSILNRLPRISSHTAKKFNNTSTVTFESFVFFPMQVSSDAQMLINSDVDNIDVLNTLLRLHSKIVVKLHPAETNYSYMNKWFLENKNLIGERVIISDENTYDLIQRSSSVAVINSTVGLESMILGKKVDFYGRSYFREFNRDNVHSYIFDYLVDVDFYSSDPISSTSLNKIYH